MHCAQRGAINLLVAWAKERGLAKTKADCRSVRRVGFKGIHWAWMGISALQYWEQCRDTTSLFDANSFDRGEPLQWLFYFARFLARFPWNDVALDPTGPTPLKHRQGLKYKGDAVLVGSRGTNVIYRPPPQEALEQLANACADGRLPELIVVAGARLQQKLAPARLRPPPRIASVSSTGATATCTTTVTATPPTASAPSTAAAVFSTAGARARARAAARKWGRLEWRAHGVGAGAVAPG